MKNETVLTAAIVALGGLLLSPIAVTAQSWPVKPIRVIVPWPGGGSNDAAARPVAQKMSEYLGVPMVIENRAGAAGTIGAEVVARAPADGYTLMVHSATHVSNASTYKSLSYRTFEDFTPIGFVSGQPWVLVVHPSLPVKTARQLVDLAKARPGAINYASAGAGSPTFIGGELFRFVTGANMLHVPYRGGGEAINAMVSGETAVYFAPLASAMPHVRSGRLRPLAAMSDRRIALVPEVPTIAEAGFPGAESGFWHGSMVPTGTPVEVINALHAATVIALKRDDIAKRLSDVGYSVIGDPPATFQAFVKAEVEKWRKVVQATGLTAD